MAEVKSWMGRVAYALYRALPMRLERRLAVKEWLFRRFPTVFRGTNAYRRWLAFGGGVLPPVNEDVRIASGNPTTDRLPRFLQDLQRSAGVGAEDFVPLPAELSAPRQFAVKAIAFYLPQFHPISENDEWWGRGFTEWTNVSKALPQFAGHHQPHLPGELGFYDLRIVDAMRRQAELARLYGLHGFCFHHYWFAGRRLLERPLDQLLANPDIDLPFCICWANENWTRRWDGHEHDVLLGQDHCATNDLRFIQDALVYLRDPRYIRINGRPLLVVYRPSLLPNCQQTVDVWRKVCREAGIGELFVAMVQFDVDDPRLLGFDAAIEFPPHKLARGLPSINHTLDIYDPDYAGYVVDYAQLAQRGRDWPIPEYAQFKGVAPRWDNEARKPGRGYTFAHSTPALYRQWLEHAIDFAAQHPVEGESVVFINAWNEWAEGAYLEPDRRYGYAYLQATRDALECRDIRGKVLVISHDAHPHGAQYLALHLVRELKQGLGFDVEVLLQGSGPLEREFEALAKVHKAYRPGESISCIANDLKRRGFGLAIANTAVAGRIVPDLHAAGMRIVALVHELPGIIRDYGLQEAVRAMVEHSDHVVVAAEAVRRGLCEFVDAKDIKATLILRPQGLFARNRHRGKTDFSEARKRLRERLGLRETARIVLAVGYADRRKGVDLLADVALRVCRRIDDVHFIWVGHRDEALATEVVRKLESGGCRENFHFMGLDFDTDDYYAGADVYALASREDPFPSVVLESLSVGTPIVAFSGTGGGADLIAETGGITVPAFDIESYADALARILSDGALRLQLGRSGSERIDAEFSFRRYAMDLMSLGGMAMPRVSVVVPNYNYAHYLKDRLASIAGQSLPPYEIIVLDDCSTDASLDVLQAMRPELNPEPVVVQGRSNSGSVFRQWLQGVERSRGEFVWIAEADDLAKPDMLERLARLLLHNPAAVFAYSQSEQIDEAGNVLAPDYLAYTHGLCPGRWEANYVAEGNGEVAAGMAVKNTIPNVSAALFRREPLLRVLREHIEEIAKYRIAGDWMVYLWLLKEGGVAFEAKACNQHRRHASSVTQGSATRLHMDEVERVQHAAQTLFDVPAETRAAAAAYAKSLREQFGLAEDCVGGG